jgi:prefoldin subunit 5
MKGVSEQLFTDFGQQAASMEQKIDSVEQDSNELLKRFKDKLQKFDNYEEYLDNSINAIEDAKSEINHNLELIRSLGKQDMATDTISKAQSTSRQQPPQFDPELDKELNQEPEELGLDLPLDIPDETIPDEENLELREDTRVSNNNYSLEEKEWLATHLPNFVRLYKKLYPRDLGTIIDENGLDQMIEADAHLMYQYHAIISSRVVREKFDITHRNLLNAYRKRNTEQGSLFNESLIYEYETALNNISQIRY